MSVKIQTVHDSYLSTLLFSVRYHSRNLYARIFMEIAWHEIGDLDMEGDKILTFELDITISLLLEDLFYLQQNSYFTFHSDKLVTQKCVQGSYFRSITREITDKKKELSSTSSVIYF